MFKYVAYYAISVAKWNTFFIFVRDVLNLRGVQIFFTSLFIIPYLFFVHLKGKTKYEELFANRIFHNQIFYMWVHGNSRSALCKNIFER